jgi:hypothetical protein
MQEKTHHLGQERGIGLQPRLAADEHHAATALLRAVHRKLEEERGLTAVFAANGKHRRMREYCDSFGSITVQCVRKGTSSSKAM